MACSQSLLTAKLTLSQFSHYTRKFCHDSSLDTQWRAKRVTVYPVSSHGKFCVCGVKSVKKCQFCHEERLATRQLSPNTPYRGVAVPTRPALDSEFEIWTNFAPTKNIYLNLGCFEYSQPLPRLWEALGLDFSKCSQFFCSFSSIVRPYFERYCDVRCQC